MLRSKQQQLQDLTEQVNSLSLEKAEVLDKSTHNLLEKDSQLKASEIKLALNESKVKQTEDDLKYLQRLNEKNQKLINELEEQRDDAKVEAERARRELEHMKDQVEILKSKKRYKLGILALQIVLEIQRDCIGDSVAIL
jgi:hypothetical protein